MIKTLYWLRKTLNQIPETNELNGKKIALSTLRLLPLPIHQELFLANIVAKKGAKVYVIIDNGLYKHWDTYQRHDKQTNLNPYTKWYRNFSYIKTILNCKLLLYFYRHPNISILSSKSIINVDEISKVELSSEDIANNVSSVRRYTESGCYDSTNIEHYDYYLKSEYNSKISKLIGQYLISSIKIDKLITSHGIYSLWGPLYSEVQNSNIPAYVYGAHTYRDDEILYTSTLAQTLSLDSSWLHFDTTTELTVEQNEMVCNYFNLRIQLKAKDTKIYYGKISTFEDINIKKSSPEIMNIGLFPNIIWDGDIVQRDTYFEGVLDWVLKTIKFAETSKHNFIIRFHPAEATLFTESPKLKDALLEKYPALYDLKNVILIDSHLKIDTYKFIEQNIDLGIVYDGILAMELTHMKKPVISPSISRFSSGVFIIKPETEDEYYEYLSDKKLIEKYFNDREEIDLKFRKYAFWYLFEAGYFMPIYDKNEYGKIIYTNKTIEYINSKKFARLETKLIQSFEN